MEALSKWELERQERERAEQEAITHIRKLVTEIAAALGEGWSFDSASYERDTRNNGHPPSWFKVNGPKRAQLHMHVSREDARKLHVSVDYPRTKHGENGEECIPYEERRDGKARLSMNAALDKGAEKIAKEIARRILPEYLRLLALCLIGIAESDASADRRTENFLTLAAITGSKFSEENKKNTYLHLNLPGASYGAVRVSDNSVSFDRLSTSFTKAERILKILAEKE